MNRQSKASAQSMRMKALAQKALADGRQFITLREARLNAKVSIEKAAEFAGITVRTMRSWEANCGKVRSFSIYRLFSLYGVNPNHVFAGDETILHEVRIEYYKNEVLKNVTG